MSGALYVVATPLGNLEDLSQRAQKVLADADLIACEDTRHTRKLLSHYSIQTPTTSYHDHNEEHKSLELLGLLEEGKRIVLVSDAGTPLLSDPGYRIVSACRREGIPVYPVPGPSAAVSALSVSGLPTDRFLFVGFLPRRVALQRKQLGEMSRFNWTLVLFLSPHGLLATLARILEELGNRKAFLAREMTKMHESAYFGPLEDIIAALHQEPTRGEYTLVVEGLAEESKPQLPIDVAAYLAGLQELRGLGPADAAKIASRQLGLPRRKIYSAINKKA